MTPGVMHGRQSKNWWAIIAGLAGNSRSAAVRVLCKRLQQGIPLTILTGQTGVDAVKCQPFIRNQATEDFHE